MKRLYRSENDSKIAGICGGVGEVYDVDPTVVRLSTVFLCVATGILPVIVTYVVGWMIIPTKPLDEMPEEKG